MYKMFLVAVTILALKAHEINIFLYLLHYQ